MFLPATIHIGGEIKLCACINCFNDSFEQITNVRVYVVHPVSRGATLCRWCTIVSGTFRYDDPRWKCQGLGKGDKYLVYASVEEWQRLSCYFL